MKNANGVIQYVGLANNFASREALYTGITAVSYVVAPEKNIVNSDQAKRGMKEKSLSCFIHNI